MIVGRCPLARQGKMPAKLPRIATGPTGGASGMGAAAVRRLTADGIQVVLLDLDPAASHVMAASLPGQGHLGLAVDVSDESASFLTIREMLRRRSQRSVEHGRIVNISSSAAQIGGYNGSAAYVSSKGAILSLTKLAAREAAPLGVTVNAIAPGTIDTPLLRSVMPTERDAAYAEKIPMARIGKPADVVAAFSYLVSVDAGYVIGSCLDVNGGLRMQ